MAEGNPGLIGHGDEGLDGVQLGGHLGTRRREPVRHPARPSPLGQGGALAVAAGEPAAVQRTPDDDAHPVALAGGQDLGLDAPGQDRIGRLLTDEAFPVSALGHPLGLDDEITGEGRRPNGPDLPLVDEVGESAESVVDVAGRIGPVNLVQVDPLGPQPSQARLDFTGDPTARVARHVGISPHGGVHLGGQYHPVAPTPGQRLAHDLLGLTRRIDIGGVHEIDAGVQRGVDDADAVVMVGVAPRAEHHRPQAQRGHPHAGVTQRVRSFIVVVPFLVMCGRRAAVSCTPAACRPFTPWWAQTPAPGWWPPARTPAGGSRTARPPTPARRQGRGAWSSWEGPGPGPPGTSVGTVP